MVAYQICDYYTADSAWTLWVSDATSGSTATVCTAGDAVWYTWASADSTSTANTAYTLITNMFPPVRWEAPAETPAQRRQREAREARRRAAEQARWDAEAPQRAAAERQRKMARMRARALLMRHLSAAQRCQYLRDGSFELQTPSGTRFRIRRGVSGNVTELHPLTAKPVAHYCIHPDGYEEGDVHLAQKLLLETDEPAFRRIANRTPVGRIA